MTDVMLIVDMLKGFHNIGKLANPRVNRIIPNVAMLLHKKSREECWLIFLGDSHEPDDEEFKIWPPHCIKGSEEAEIIDEFRPFLRSKRTIYIPKTRYSGFFRTELEKILGKIIPVRVIVVGVCTDICILHTVADLRMRNYQTLIPKDCVETFDTPEHSAEKVNKATLCYLENVLGAKIVEKAEDTID
jgi:nicotinamidase/pyrazinamidase